MIKTCPCPQGAHSRSIQKGVGTVSSIREADEATSVGFLEFLGCGAAPREELTGSKTVDKLPLVE